MKLLKLFPVNTLNAYVGCNINFKGIKTHLFKCVSFPQSKLNLSTKNYYSSFGAPLYL